MPNYDLSSADLGRVAGFEVDLLRVANQTVWEKPFDVSSWTIFDEAALDLASFNDAANTDGLMNQFYKYAGVDLEVFQIGLYIPSGSLFIGNSGYVQAMFSSGGFLRGNGYSTSDAIASRVSTPTLVEGWNWTTIPTPFPWTDASPYILAGYKVFDDYLFNGASSSTPITTSNVVSIDGKFELIPTAVSSGQPERSWYDEGVGFHSFVTTFARSYGVDIRVREA